MGSTRRLTRRRALGTLAGGALTASAGCLELDTSALRSPPFGPNEIAAYRVGATTGAWVGLEPPIIAQLRNPTLEFAPGQRVEITWVNLDGNPHQFLVEDSTGNVLVRSEVTTTEGATRTVTFEARQEMVEYVCDFHPVQMRGVILVTEN